MQYLGLDVGEVVQINFDMVERVETENWTAVVVEPLPYAPMVELCVLLFRRFDKETMLYDDRELNALPFNLSQMSTKPPMQLLDISHIASP